MNRCFFSQICVSTTNVKTCNGEELTCPAVEGEFVIQIGAERRLVQPRDFLVVTGELEDGTLTASEGGGEAVVVDVPAEVSYSLLEK